MKFRLTTYMIHIPSLSYTYSSITRLVFLKKKLVEGGYFASNFYHLQWNQVKQKQKKEN